MKLLATNAFTEETVELKKWAEMNAQDLTITHEPLTADNIEQVKGFDALSVQQVVPLGGPEVYEKLASFGIKQIAVRSVGYEFVDLAAAKANHLTVTNVPVYSPRSVAEYVLGQSMRLFRNFDKFDADVAKQDFTWLGKISPEFADLTVGIIGAGHIGSAVAKIYHALGSKVLVNDPIHYDEVAAVAKYVSLEDVLKYSDIVTLHVPLTDETHYMINADTLGQMKPSAYLINAARGAVTKTQDLIAALKNQQIAGAALDVWEGEGAYFDYDWQNKPLNNPELETLLALPNVILTPHIAFFTEHSVHNIAFTALDDAFLGASGKTVKNPVLG
ncbi:D-2-hydroxyacid dehydrogenase [Agrilactobacillus yilanensis]|uniref:D-2-hydroxyacid dehydrogenase n=1 Tax=Agrilactobacillus yilanensis TaxID=2485997 RepID=A0ABW4J6P3_9LACO|nr:D-2-hydroxyacid dehydrogenase [Agrilactobacillus yilanensis]